MVSVKDVSAQKAINLLKEELKKIPAITMPEWAKYVKTGSHCERKPQEEDWWYTRCASVLRKIYINSNIGVGRLRTWYGGRKNRGSKPEKHAKAGGKVLRVALQQLEKAGLVQKQKVGRTLSAKGRSLVDKATIKIKGETVGKRRTETKGTTNAKPAVVKKDVGQKSAGKISKDKPGKSKPIKKD